jgi:hypothetical protein
MASRAQFRAVSDLGVERQLRQLLSRLRPGKRWAVNVNGDDITVRRYADPAAAPVLPAAVLLLAQAKKEEALRLCRYRSELCVGSDYLRRTVTRAVSWDLVRAWWRHLASTPIVLSRRMRVRPRPPGAHALPDPGLVFADPAQKLTQLLKAVTSDGGFRCPLPGDPDPQLWLRFGADAVPLWGYSVTSVTVSVASLVGPGRRQSWTEQQAGAWAVLAVCNRGDTGDILQQLISETGIVKLSEDIDGKPWTVQCAEGHVHRVRIRTFWVGDHMFLHKLTGADGVGSTLQFRRPCPWCDAAPADLTELVFARPLQPRPKPDSMTRLPVDQVLADPLHGLRQVVNVCVARAMCDWTRVELGAHAADRAMAELDGTITGTLRFVKGRLYGEVVGLLYQVHGARSDLGRAALAVWETLREQVALLWQPTPLSPAQVDRFSELSRALAVAATTLQLNRTIWLHVWVVHLPQLVRRWGTLYHAIGHGFEGRHRLLKLQVKCSPRSQWKGDGAGAECGFATVVRRDNARLALLTLPDGPWATREPVARDRRSAAACLAAFPGARAALILCHIQLVFFVSTVKMRRRLPDRRPSSTVPIDATHRRSRSTVNFFLTFHNYCST